MRTEPLLGTGRSFYHVMSRVVDRRRVFEAKDKEIFRKILRNQEAFTGVRVVTYCLMSNHFHLLLEVPDRETLAPLDEEGLLAVLPLLYPGDVVEGVKQELERARAAGDERWHREILSRYERRRGDLGLFLKEVKLRLTFHMNKRLGRTGTLWEGRYKSVLVEDPAPSPGPLSADPDDEYLIDLARAARVDALVTGDVHLLDLRETVPVVTPREFLASLTAAL